MTTKDCLELNGAHLALLKHKGIGRTAAYRAHRNSSTLQSLTESLRAAFTATIQAEKAKHNGDLTPDAEAKLQQEVWTSTMGEEVGDPPSLRKLPAGDLPWEEIEPEVAGILMRAELIDGDVEETK